MISNNIINGLPILCVPANLEINYVIAAKNTSVRNEMLQNHSKHPYIDHITNDATGDTIKQKMGPLEDHLMTVKTRKLK